MKCLSGRQWVQTLLASCVKKEALTGTRLMRKWVITWLTQLVRPERPRKVLVQSLAWHVKVA